MRTRSGRHRGTRHEEITGPWPGRALDKLAPVEPTDRPWYRRPVTWLLAVPLVVAVVVLLWSFGGGSAPDEDQTAAPAAPAPSMSFTGDAPTTCDPQEPQPTAVTAAPPDLQWRIVGGMLAPGATSAGPGRVATYAECFTRSPMGAAFAAMAMLTEMEASIPGQEQVDLLAARAARTDTYGPAVAEASSSIVKQTTDMPMSRPLPPGRQISGVRWISWTPDVATVEILLRFTEGPNLGKLQATTQTVAWQNNDWRWVVPTLGVTAHRAVRSMDGFLPLSGV